MRGYSIVPGAMGNQVADAAAFNAQDHKRTDNNWDLTALARYTPNEAADIEFGVARKVRSPNLYESYTWSTWSMAATMNNTVGDGNGYFGNLDLKPEVAHTVAATFDWHAADRSWEIKATPLLHARHRLHRCRPLHRRCLLHAGQPDDDQSVRRAAICQPVGRALRHRCLRADAARRRPASAISACTALLGYIHGKNRDTGDGLYNIMPLNARSR